MKLATRDRYEVLMCMTYVLWGMGNGFQSYTHFLKLIYPYIPVTKQEKSVYWYS